MLIAVLIPCGVSAQNDVQTSSNQTFSNEELTQMLAPIALYPDTLLSQILMAATYPFEVVEAERWMTKNPYTKGDALDEALQAKDWDVSVLALCHYPKVLTMMSENLSWTARLGDAFANQEQDVMNTVQELRARARAEGNLSTTKEQKVIVEERIIRIEPYSYDYLYVPAYDPYYVYGSWWLPLFPPFSIFLPGMVVSGPGIIFSPRFTVGFGVFGWSFFNWGDHHVFITNMDRTRRFNRRYHGYRDAGPSPWLPDRDRRQWREKRAGEIPRFHPPTAPARERWDRPSGSDVMAPAGRTVTPGKPRMTDGNKRSVTPRISDPGSKPGAGKPGVINRDQRPRWDQPQIQKDRTPAGSAPPVINKGRPQTLGPATLDKGQPVIRDRDKIKQPRVIDRGKPQASGPGTIDNEQPVIRDRGNGGVNRPAIDQRGMGADRDRGPGIGGDQRITPRENRQDMPRWDRPDRGGMRGGERKK